MRHLEFQTDKNRKSSSLHNNIIKSPEYRTKEEYLKLKERSVNKNQGQTYENVCSG
jgi:hypothetical protein